MYKLGKSKRQPHLLTGKLIKRGSDRKTNVLRDRKGLSEAKILRRKYVVRKIDRSKNSVTES